MKKRNPEIIERFVDNLKQESWLQSRRWWPNFVFHTTSLKNAVNILNNGFLYSRRRVLSTSSLCDDIADQLVISGTDEKWKDFVRFYLRPKTPTLYLNEGVKPSNSIINNAHCAVPVCLLFRAKDILTNSGCIYTDGNLGSSSVQTSDDPSFFTSLPFRKIYHEGKFPPSARDEIIFHRNAEAIIPHEIDLSHLHYISCRTIAEKETLIHLLKPDSFFKWSGRIGVSTRYPVFNEQWNFVREVNFTGSQIVVNFNEQTSHPRGPFKFTWGVDLHNGGKKYEIIEPEYFLENDFEINLNSYSNKSLCFWMMLDDNLVYMNDFYHEADLPF